MWEKHHSQRTWEGKSIVDLPHRAVGGPHGSEGSLALRHIVLSGTQLLLGEELTLTHLLWYFKTNPVPLRPYTMFGKAAKRRAHLLRAHKYMHRRTRSPTSTHSSKQMNGQSPSAMLHSSVPPLVCGRDKRLHLSEPVPTNGKQQHHHPPQRSDVKLVRHVEYLAEHLAYSR